MRRVALFLVGNALAACGSSDGVPEEPASIRAALNPPVVINEHASGSSGWVELYNDGDQAADVSGWIVDDITSGGTAAKTLPAGSIVSGHGWLVVSYSGFNTASADTVTLLDATMALVDSHTNGYAGSSVAGLCFGRQPDGGPWANGSVACTKGSSNAASPPTPAAVVINEFQAGSSGWMELYNPGDVAADLSGWSIDDVASGGTSPKSLGAGVSLAAKGFLVVAYGGVNTASADSVRLLDNVGATVDEHANYYAGASIAGLCFGRQPDGALWGAGAIPCTKGASNSASPPPPAAKVLINEFHPGSAGWVELFNAGAELVDLTGWKIDDVASGGASPKAIAAGTTLGPGQVVRVAFGGINTASADEVRLLDSGNALVDSHASFFGTDPCYGTGRCYGRLPDGGAWAPAHIPCTGGATNPLTVPALCVPGQACDDGNACTTGDTCSSSCACTAGAALSCDDQDPCTTDACWPDTGCTHPAAPDGLSCGSGQQCQGGVCGGTAPAPCVATGGTYKTVTFTKAEECLAVQFLNKARYSQMNAITTTARDIAYDCSPGNTCGYRSAAWSTVAQYAAANGGSSTLTVGTTSLVALRTASATWVDDGSWYDTVAHTFANKDALNNVWVHLESVFAESWTGLCLVVRDAPGAVNYLSACVDPWYCGPDGCDYDYMQAFVGKSLSVRGRLTNETGSWRIAVKTIRNANPALL